MSTKIKRGAAAWAFVGMLFLAWSGVVFGVNAAERDRAKEARAHAQKIEHFYQVVDGEISGSESGPANKLARDLKALPADQLEEFRGDSNRYGGIAGELGFDPFDGINCSECGPLDQEVIENVQTVKDGGLEQVLEGIESGIPTPNEAPRPPTFMWLLWLFSLPIAAGVVYLQKQRSEEDRYRGFPEERRLLAQLREAKGELPPGNKEWLALDQLADRLQEQIDMRVSYKKSKTQEMKLDALTQEASSALEDIAAGNKALD